MEQNDVVAQLEHALVRQADAIRTGRWTEFEKAFEDSQRLSEQIHQSSLRISDEQKERIMDLYCRLLLLAGANMAYIRDQITSIRMGRRLVGTYRDDLPT